MIGSDGDTIGKVGQVYLDNQTGQPSWVTVKAGWFGTGPLPLNAATTAGEDITVPYDKTTSRAPRTPTPGSS